MPISVFLRDLDRLIIAKLFGVQDRDVLDTKELKGILFSAMTQAEVDDFIRNGCETNLKVGVV